MGQNKIFTVIGTRGAGKTPFVIGGDFEEGLAKMYLRKQMSTLIVDELDHPSYRHIPSILPDNFKKLSSHPSIYRCLSSLQHISDLVKKIAYEKLVWNTLLVLEDANKYLPQFFGKTEKTLLGNSKQQNVDIVVMYWCWGDVPPSLLRLSNYLVIFNTADSPDSRKEYIKGCYDQCMEAYSLVKKKKHPYLIVETGV